ncbi:MAG TPA: pectin acetylesterase-family hydrolase [Polyangiaceae bacterium]|nr:pectin acetylesterase-family hydrolase [Polyangiaceae bacterium]
MTWKAVPTAGAICRDKSATGFAVNLNMASDKLVIFMEGGGACFNTLTCGMNPRAWAATDANATPVGSKFVMNRAAAGNPFKDWNMAYIPYCTGDVHTGTNMAGFNGDAHMGYSNYLKYLGKLVATFKGKPLTQVVLSGLSAGGFGVAWNWMTTQDAFGVPVTALDDSGPPYGPMWLSACHQQRTGMLWGWSGSVHPSCTACDVAGGNVVIPLLEASMQRQTTRFGFVSHDEDGTIKSFLAYGLNNCASWDALLPPAFPAGQYPMALADLRTRWMSNPQAAMYVVAGASHTFLASDLSTIKTGTNITMLEWVNKLVNNDTGWTNINP